MTFNITSSQFYTRIYHGLLDEFSKEVSNGFPLLSKIFDMAVFELLEVMNSMSQEEQAKLLTTLIRSVYHEQHNEVLNDVNDVWNDEDECILRNFREQIYNINGFKWFNLEQNFEERFPLNFLHNLKLEIYQKISSGNKITFVDEGYKITSRLQVDDWYIDTKIEFDEPPATILSYYHTVVNNDGWELTSDKFRIFGYLGLCLSWDMISFEGISKTSDLVALSIQKSLAVLETSLKNLAQPKLSPSEHRILQIRKYAEKNEGEFKERLYDWSLKDAQREVEEGFPFISNIYNGWANSALLALRKFEPVDRKKAASALVKYANRKNVSLERVLTTEELDFLRNTRYVETVDISDSEIELVSSSSNLRSITKRKFRSLLKERLSASVGKAFAVEGSSWKHRIDIGFWKITTYIETDSGLSYSHHISDKDTGVFVIGSAHVLGWLGIGETYWDIQTDAEALNAIETLVAVCNHFLNAMPELLAGLDPSEGVELMRLPLF